MKKAFTMLELVFVIVVIGILAAVVIPRIGSDKVSEAAIQLVSHVRYAQHLALVDDKFDAGNNEWYKNRWQIKFDGNSYSIISDNNNTSAKDPMDSSRNIQVNLLQGYGVRIEGGSCGNNAVISFDYIGRPFSGDLSGITSAYPVSELMTSDCTIVLTDGTESAIITITKETGYIKL